MNAICIGDYDRLYREYFGKMLDLRGIRIPLPPDSDSLPLVLDARLGISIHEVIKACENEFPMPPLRRSFGDVENIARSRFRFAQVIWVPRGMASKGIKTLTLFGALVFSLMHFNRTKTHYVKFARCDGSRFPGGAIPCIGVLSARLAIGYVNPPERPNFLF